MRQPFAASTGTGETAAVEADPLVLALVTAQPRAVPIKRLYVSRRVFREASVTLVKIARIGWSKRDYIHAAMALFSAVWSLILAAFCASGQQAGKSRVCRVEDSLMGLAVMLRGRMMAMRVMAAEMKVFMFTVRRAYFSFFLWISAPEMV